MDWMELKQKIKKDFRKFKFPVFILCVGILLMTMPTKDEEITESVPVSETQQQTDISQRLEKILEYTCGVGKVRVMLTESAAAETVYQTDEDRSQSESSTDSRVSTVIVSSGSVEQGLVRTVTPPVYLGAVIVCQGGDDPAVRLAITQAVSVLTGIGTDRITVLKMK